MFYVRDWLGPCLVTARFLLRLWGSKVCLLVHCWAELRRHLAGGCSGLVRIVDRMRAPATRQRIAFTRWARAVVHLGRAHAVLADGAVYSTFGQLFVLWRYCGFIRVRSSLGATAQIYCQLSTGRCEQADCCARTFLLRPRIAYSLVQDDHTSGFYLRVPRASPGLREINANGWMLCTRLLRGSLVSRSLC